MRPSSNTSRSASCPRDRLRTSRPPPGSGPFILDEYVSGEKVALKANPLYWEKKPALDGLVFKIVPDAMVRALEFKQGAIDFMQNDLEPDMLPWLKSQTNAEVTAHQGTTFQYIGINLTHPILRQLKVRQALAHAIDRARIIRHLLKDAAIAANGLISPLNEAYDNSVMEWPYDPAKAKQLLDDAGFTDPDGDGPKSALSAFLQDDQYRSAPAHRRSVKGATAASRHRAGDPQLRVGHVFQRCEKRQLPSLLARLGRHPRPGCSASNLSFGQRTAQRRQPRPLRQPASRSITGSRPRRHGAGGTQAHLWCSATADRRGPARTCRCGGRKMSLPRRPTSKALSPIPTAI